MAYTSIADFFTEMDYHIVEPAHETFLFGYNAAKNVVDISADSRANSDTHQSSLLRSGVDLWRNSIAASMGPLAANYSLLLTANNDLKDLIGTEQTSLTGIFSDLHDYMMAGENVTGTAAFTTGSTAVTGAASSFTTEIGGIGAVLNKWVYYEADGPDYAVEVASVTNDTALVLSANYQGAGGLIGAGGRLRLVQTIEEQNFTRGAISASALNSGDGTILSRTTDWTPLTFDIEDGIAGTIKYECMTDNATGTGKTGTSSWNVYYEGLLPYDSLEFPTALKGTTLSGVPGWTSESVTLVNNSTFQDYTSTAGVNKFTNWIINTGDDARFSQYEADIPDNYVYRALSSTLTEELPSGTGYSAKITLGAETYIYQRLTNYGKTFEPRTAYIVSAMVITDNAGDPGTIYIDFGNQQTTPVLLTAAWQRVYGIYFTEEFTDSVIDIKITRTISSTGNAYVSNLIVCPCNFFNGRCFGIMEGSHTATNNDFIRGDFFTNTDTVAGYGKFSYWTNRFMRALAAPGYNLLTSSNPTITDPA